MLTQFFGILAGLISAITFLPQAYRTIKTGHTKDLSLPSYILLTLGGLTWIVYGSLLGEWPIVISNSVISIAGLIVVILKIKNG